MGYTREEQELEIRVTGQAQLANLRTELERQEKALAKAATARDQDAASQAAWESKVKEATPVIQDLRIQIANLEKSLSDQRAEAKRAAADFVAAEREKAEAAKRAAEEIERAQLKEIANRGATGPAWGSVMQNAGTSAAAATRDDAKAKRELADAAAKAAGDVAKLTAEERENAEATKRAAAAAAEYTKLTKKQGDAAKETKSKVAGLGQAGMQVGRAFQDLVQGGVGGVLNNIEGLVMALGGKAGLAGALTVVGTLLFIFRDQIKKAFDFRTYIDAGNTAIDSLKAKLEELEKKPVKLAVDMTEIEIGQKKLKQLEQATAAFNHLQSMVRSREERSGKAIEATLAEAGGPELSKRLKEQAAKEIEKTDPTIGTANQQIAKSQARLEEIKKTPMAFDADGTVRDAMIAQNERQIKEAQEAIAQRRQAIRREKGDAEDRVGQALVDARKGKVSGLSGQLRGIGRDDLAYSLDQSTPEALEQQDKLRAAVGNQAGNLATRIGVRETNQKKALDKVVKAYGEEITKAMTEEFAKGVKEQDASANVLQMFAPRVRAEKAVPAGLASGAVYGAIEQLRTGITPKQIDEARQKLAEDKNKPDKKELERLAKIREELVKGVGDDYLARAEAQRLDIEVNDAYRGKGKRDDARSKFKGRFQGDVYNVLKAKGVEGGRAEEIANEANKFMDEDIQRQLIEQRTLGGPQGREAEYEALRNRLLLKSGQQTPQQPARLPQQGFGGAPMGGGNGFMSVPPTAAGAGAGAQQAQGFTAYHQAAMQALQMQQAQAMQMQQILAAATQQLEAFGMSTRNQWRAIQVQSYSYAPNHW